jgi:hypothetical protein
MTERGRGPISDLLMRVAVAVDRSWAAVIVRTETDLAL